MAANNCDNCNDNEKKIQLQSHQTTVCNFFKNSFKHGILLFHGMGTGKTLTSIFILKCLSKAYKNNNGIIVLTPKSLVANYEKELKKASIPKELLDTITIRTYTKGLKEIEKQGGCRDKILVIDEAHNFKNLYSKRTSKAIACSELARKVILLSATPLVNNTEEIIPLMKMITYYSVSDIRKMIKGSVNDFSTLFNCNISYYTKSKDDEHYPKMISHVKRIEMDDEYYNAYYKIQEDIKDKDTPEIFKDNKNLVSFLNGVRRGVNKLKQPSKKIKFCLKIILENLKNNRKVLIYSNWLSAGIDIISKYLRTNGIAYSIITGSLSKEERDQQMKLYNKGVTKIMLLTSAGGEGLSLIETRVVMVLEPHWNKEKINQLIGRAIRYKSHSRLPVEERVVNVYHLLLKKPVVTKLNDTQPSADEYLFSLGNIKHNTIEKFYKRLKPHFIENNRDCIKN